MTNFARCCAVTLDYEGGNDDDPRDPGGRTSRGILQREWNAYRAAHTDKSLPADVWKAPQADIVAIYNSGYWQPISGDAWPIGADLCVYDAGVNSGLGAAKRWAIRGLDVSGGTFAQLAGVARASKNVVGVIDGIQQSRLSFLHGLRTWGYFGKGWAHRVAGIQAIATRWALAAEGTPPAPVLSGKAQVSATKRKQAATAGTSSTAPVAVHTVAFPHLDWIDWLTLGAMAVATLLFVVYCWHVWRLANAQAAAYSTEATKRS